MFVPGGIPPHKEASSVRATAEDRLAMVEAAVEGNERFTVDRVEIDAGRADAQRRDREHPQGALAR